MGPSNYNTCVILRSNQDTTKIAIVQFILRPNYCAFYISARSVKTINENPDTVEWYMFGLPTTVTGFFQNWNSASPLNVGYNNFKDSNNFIYRFPLSDFQFEIYSKMYNLIDI